MAAFSRAESRHHYSWWWNSHISPKNSKWLQENLTDMDMKVKAMIKLIEEDADSFARRAEMYYKKRPELIKLVEDFYRAYRALAERYDHATVALRQAHRTMAEAFPNQIPEMIYNRSPNGSSTSEVDPCTPEMTPPLRANFDLVGLQKDESGFSSDSHFFKRNGAYSEETNSFSSKDSSKQSSEVSATPFGEVNIILSEGKVQKGPNFLELANLFDTKSPKGSTEHPQVKTNRNSSYLVENLQQEVTMLSTENQNLKSQSMEVFDRANKAENELQSLKDTLYKLNLEKDADHLHYQSSLERISSLEGQLSNAQNDLKKLDKMLDEIQRLKDQKSKLEDEVGHHVGEKEVVGRELLRMKEDRNDLEKRHQDVMQQLQAVSIASETLQATIENLEGSCKEQEAENKLLLDKLKDVENILDKNVILENSLSDANAELEILREKLSALERLHDSLKLENDALVSTMETLTQNIQELSNKNTLLETTISDLNSDVGLLSSKLAEVEGFCQFLNNQNSTLLAQKDTLSAQVESVIINLENLKNKFKDLHYQLPRLSIERDVFIDQLKELQKILEVQKKEYKVRFKSYKTQMAALENKITVLQAQKQLKETEVETEKNHLFAAMIENFVLQASLCDVYKSNLALSLESQKHLEAYKSADALILQLKQEELMHSENIMLLTRSNEKISSKIRTLSNTLFTDTELGSDYDDEVLLDVNIVKIEKLLNCVSDTGFDIQQLHLQTSILVTLLKHIALDMADLKLEKFSYEQEVKHKAEKISLLQDKQHELLQLNEELARNFYASNQREEVLKAEVKVQQMQLSKLQEALYKSENEIHKLVEENKNVSEEFYSLRQKNDGLLEEHVQVLAELIKLDNLHTFYKSVVAEKLLELQSFKQNLISLCSVKDSLHSETNRLKVNICLLKAETMQVTNLYTYLQEEFRNCLLIQEFDFNALKIAFEDLDIESDKMKNQLMLTGTQLSEANHKVQSTQNKNMELLELLNTLYMENEEAKLVKEELRKSTFYLSETVAHRNDEIRNLREGNEMLQNAIRDLHGEVELDFVALYREIHFYTVYAAICEEKVNELILEGEIHSLAEKLVLSKQLGFLKSQMDELMQKHDDLMNENRVFKDEMDAYVPLISSLWNGVASLEGQIMSMLIIRPSNNLEEEMSTKSDGHDANKYTGDINGDNIVGLTKLEKLIAKIEAIGREVTGRKKFLELERLNLNTELEAAKEKIEELKMKTLPGQTELQSIQNDGRDEGELSKVKGQMIKDIELDQVSSLVVHNDSSYNRFKNRNDEISHQLLISAESEFNNHMHKASSLAIEYDTKAVKEENREEPTSELVEEINVHKLEMSSIDLASEQSWNNDKLLEKLVYDSRRMSDLKIIINGLKSRMDHSEMDKLPKAFGYDTVKAQLKEAEVAILELIDANKIMSNKVDNYYSLETMDMKSKEASNLKRRLILEQVKMESLKVGRLELALHKIQYLWLKLEEELESRFSKSNERRRVLLGDYLYGRRDSPRLTRKRRSVWCISPKTTGD